MGMSDFLRAIRTCNEVGYDGMLMPVHVPKIDGDEQGRRLLRIASATSGTDPNG